MLWHMQVHDYSGTNRQRDPSKLAKYDVIVVSYAMVTRELTQEESTAEATPAKGVQVPAEEGLFSTKYRRVVLDEGHTISNTSSKVRVAASQILPHALLTRFKLQYSALPC